jgi:hypothetical protein
MADKTQECCAISLPIVLSYCARLIVGQPKMIRNITRHALVDLAHYAPRGVIEGVVEVEEPEWPSPTLPGLTGLLRRLKTQTACCLVRPDHRANTFIGQNLEQQAMRHPTINHVNRLNATFCSLKGR